MNISVLQSHSSESVGGGVPSAESDETLVAASPTCALKESNQTTVGRKTRGMCGSPG